MSRIERVVVHVEGPSDREAMARLLAGLIDQLANAGIHVSFADPGGGNRKKRLVEDQPAKLAHMLIADRHAAAVVLPDLYPHAGFGRTVQELRDNITKRFESALRKRLHDTDTRVSERFHVFCFKHDLEVLLLCLPEALSAHLGATVRPDWAQPPEEQNHDEPPKRVVERLFQSHGQRYDARVHAPDLLAGADCRALAAQCPDGFGPFVDYLAALLPPSPS